MHKRMRAVAVVAGALTLAGCGGDLLEGLFGPPPPVTCPRVSLPEDTVELTRFDSPLGRDIIDVVYEARIVNAGTAIDANGRRQCFFDDDDGRIEAAVVVEIEVNRGPASRDDTVNFEYYMAVVTPDQQILTKATYPTQIRFQPGRRRALTQEVLTVTVPADTLGGGSAFETLVGFQLTPDQVTYNREKRLR